MTSRADEVSLSRLSNCSRKMRAAVLERRRGTCTIQLGRDFHFLRCLSLTPVCRTAKLQCESVWFGVRLRHGCMTACHSETSLLYECTSAAGQGVVTCPMTCRNCSGVDRSATVLSGSSTYAFSFFISSSLGAICIKQCSQQTMSTAAMVCVPYKRPSMPQIKFSQKLAKCESALRKQ